MKRMIILISMLSIIILFGKENSIAKNIETVAGGQRIYHSIESKDSDHLKIAGINLSKHDYLKVYQYLLLKDRLFVIGLTKSGVCEFSCISLDDKNKIQISTYPSDISMQNTALTVFIMYKLDASTFSVVEYTERDINKIEIYHGAKPHGFQLLKKEDIPMESMLFLSDTNDDGFTDILIWRKSKGNEKDINNRGEMMSMFFNPEDLNFSDLTLLRKTNAMN